jgi:hypothetical protein
MKKAVARTYAKKLEETVRAQFKRQGEKTCSVVHTDSPTWRRGDLIGTDADAFFVIRLVRSGYDHHVSLDRALAWEYLVTLTGPLHEPAQVDRVLAAINEG